MEITENIKNKQKSEESAIRYNDALQFLKANDVHYQLIEPIPADASFRSYYRIILKDDNTKILMDSPPDIYNIEDFINTQKMMDDYNITVPKIYAKDTKSGFLLLEDLGKISVNNHLQTLASQEVIKEYYSMIDIIMEMQKITVSNDWVKYSQDKLIAEANYLVDWYLPILTGQEVSPNFKKEYNNIWEKIFKHLNFNNFVFVHKDFHVDNLQYLGHKQNNKKYGIIDFQDAILGFRSYDLVSLLEDARYDLSSEISDKAINYFLNLNPDWSRKDFLAEYTILASQNNCRMLGIFARKAVRDKNSQYLKYIPRVKKLLAKNLQHPLLYPLQLWFDKVLL